MGPEPAPAGTLTARRVSVASRTSAGMNPPAPFENDTSTGVTSKKYKPLMYAVSPSATYSRSIELTKGGGISTLKSYDSSDPLRKMILILSSIATGASFGTRTSIEVLVMKVGVNNAFLSLNQISRASPRLSPMIATRLPKKAVLTNESDDSGLVTRM